MTPGYLPGCVPSARQQIVPIVAHDQLARGTFRLRLACPEIARQAIPGQFFMVREPGRSDPLAIKTASSAMTTQPRLKSQNGNRTFQIR